jgi:hypothetical protein
MSSRSIVPLLAFSFWMIGSAQAQAYSSLFRAGVMCGTGASASSAGTKPTFGCGVGVNPLAVVYTEIGVMGPQANRSYVTGYLTNDFILPLDRAKIVPLLFGGYTRMFETGHALDYGVGLALPTRKNKDKSVQMEIRDYLTFANPTQHNVVFRLGWVVGLPD